MKGKKFIAFIVVLWILLAVWSLPYFLRAFAVNFLEKATGLEVFLSEFSFRSPSTWVLSGLRFSWKGRECLKVEEITLKVRWKSLLSDTIEVEKVMVENPSLWIHRHRDGSFDLVRFFSISKRSVGGSSLSKRHLLIHSVSLTGGEIELLDETVQKEPYSSRLSALTVTAEDLLFPPRDRESPLSLQAFVSAGQFPPSGSLKLKGEVNLERVDLKLGVELREIDLHLWNPYISQSIPMGFEKGKLDVDGEVKIEQKHLWGFGLVHVRDLTLGRTQATALFESAFGISQEKLIAFLENSHGELIFPLKVSGDLGDPRFELGELFTSSVRQSLARTLQKGVGGMLKVGSETVGVADLEKRAKRVVKEVQKTFRLDWLLTGPPPEAIQETLPPPSTEPSTAPETP